MAESTPPQAGVIQHSESMTTLDDNELPTYESLIHESSIVQPRVIHIDGVLIFPSQPPAVALYQLSRDLFSGTRLSLKRIDQDGIIQSNNSSQPRAKDRLLYSFEHRLFDYRSIELTGKRKGCFNSTVMIKAGFFGGDNWNVSFWSTTELKRGSMILDCKQVKNRSQRQEISHEWRDTSGKVIAVEDQLYLPEGSQGMLIANPSLRVLEPLEQKVLDFLVTCWCARVWNSNLKATGQTTRSSAITGSSWKGGK